MIEIITDVDNFIDIFVKELTGLNVEAQVSDYKTDEVLTCIRRIFYTSFDEQYGASWDILIPETANLICPAAFETDPDLMASIEFLRANPQGLIQGIPVDLGHLIAGLDAGFHPAVISLKDGQIRLRSNKEAVTYVGDLGSVVMNYLFSATGSFDEIARIRDDQHLSQVFHLYAGIADMTANADAFVMPFDLEKMLADNLEAYYKCPENGLNQRFTKFAQAIGLGELENNEFSNDSRDWRDSIKAEIFNSALAIACVSGCEGEVDIVLENPGPGLPNGEPTFWEAFWNISEWVLDYFVEWMRLQIDQEQS